MSVMSRGQGGAEAGNVAVEARVRACFGHEIAVVVDDQSPPRIADAGAAAWFSCGYWRKSNGLWQGDGLLAVVMVAR